MGHRTIALVHDPHAAFTNVQESWAGTNVDLRHDPARLRVNAHDAILGEVGDPDPAEPGTHGRAAFRNVVRVGDLEGFLIDPNEHASGTFVTIRDRPDAALACTDARLSFGGNIDRHPSGDHAGLGVDAGDPSFPARRRPHGTETRIHAGTWRRGTATEPWRRPAWAS